MEGRGRPRLPRTFGKPWDAPGTHALARELVTLTRRVHSRRPLTGDVIPFGGSAVADEGASNGGEGEEAVGVAFVASVGRPQSTSQDMVRSMVQRPSRREVSMGFASNAVRDSARNRWRRWGQS
jgi:hypothetical protein